MYYAIIEGVTVLYTMACIYIYEMERNRKYRNVGMKRRWMKICVNEQEMECTASVCGKATRERGA